MSRSDNDGGVEGLDLSPSIRAVFRPDPLAEDHLLDEMRVRLLGQPERRARMDRYVVFGRLGSGAMGVVYDAFDPVLERRVALKVLHVGGDDHDAHARALLAEARAMAALGHPNIVRVFDAGRSGHGGRDVFVVMERVTGPSVREWLASENPTGKSIISVFTQAGEGLAAAHRAGFLHRDFKAQNAIVGDDGVVRVFDFSAGTRDSAYNLDYGTHRYLAPERAAGEPGDTQADQYSFCLALAEALGQDIIRFEPGQPFDAVPPWLRPILARGTNRDPGARYPAMEPLLARIRRGPVLTWRRLVVAGVAIGVSGVGLASYAIDRAAVDACLSGGPSIPGVEAIASADERFAEFELVPIRDELANLVEAHSSEAQARKAELCELPKDERVSRERLCLEIDVAREREVLDFVLEGDPRALRHSAAILRHVRPVACDSLPMDAADDLVQLERDLARAEALQLAGMWGEAVEAGTKIADEAHSAALPGLEARAGLVEARARISVESDLDRAVELSRSASEIAERAGDPTLRSDAYAVQSLAHRTAGRLDEALWCLRMSMALLPHVRDIEWRSRQLELQHAEILASEGALEQAVGEANALIERLGEDGARNDPELSARALRIAGLAHEEKREFDAAAQAYTSARDELARLLSPEHPVLDGYMYRLANIELKRGHPEEAREMYATVAERYEARGLANTPRYARLMGLSATAESTLGRTEGAVAIGTKTVRILSEALGPTHDTTLRMRNNLGLMLMQDGQADAAADLLLDLWETAQRVEARERTQLSIRANTISACQEANRWKQAFELAKGLPEAWSQHFHDASIYHHLLTTVAASAIVARQWGLAREWLGRIETIDAPATPQDRQTQIQARALSEIAGIESTPEEAPEHWTAGMPADDAEALRQLVRDMHRWSSND